MNPYQSNCYYIPKTTKALSTQSIGVQMTQIDIPEKGAERDAFLTQYLPETEKKIEDFIHSIKNTYAHEFIEILTSWIDIHKIPLAKVHKFISLYEFRTILPYLNHVDLSKVSGDSVLSDLSKNTEELCLCNPEWYSDKTEIYDDNLPLVTKLKNLRSLTINLMKVSKEGLEKFAEECKQLEKLDVLFHEQNKTRNLDSFAKLTNLSSLTLRYLFVFENDDFRFLEALPNLNEICFYRCDKITPAVVSKLKAKIVKIQSFASINEESLKLLANTCVETLILEDFISRWDGSATLQDLLPLADIKTLKHLHLNKCSNLTTAEEKVLREKLAHLETITIIQ